MPSRNATIAEAVKTALNTAAAADTFSQRFVAVRRYAPIVRLEDLPLDELVVSIVPKADGRELLTRKHIDHGVVVDVAIQKRLAANTDPQQATGNTSIDTLLMLAEQVSDWFDLSGPLAGTDAAWDSTDHDPIYAVGHLLAANTFTSLIAVTYKLAAAP
jgi:hypothetical protein